MDQYLSVAPDVKLGKNVKLSKFINLYGCEIGDDTKIGAFVEIQKNATIGKNCKISSHTFVCEGVTIEDGVFVGSDSTLVAPVKIGRGAYVAAASCITEDVPADALALGRARQSVKEGWARAKREAQNGRKGSVGTGR